jgi:hypothetical protein
LKIDAITAALPSNPQERAEVLAGRKRRGELDTRGSRLNSQPRNEAERFAAAIVLAGRKPITTCVSLHMCSEGAATGRADQRSSGGSDDFDSYVWPLARSRGRFPGAAGKD